MSEHLARDPDAIRRIVRTLETQLTELEMEALRTATGHIRNTLCDAAIHLRGAINHLTQVC